MTRELITKMTQLVDEHYVFPEVATQAVEIVNAAAAEGRYDGLGDEALADAVTEDLQKVNGDKHLRLMHHTDELPDKDDDDAVQEEFFRRWAADTGNGVPRAERLPGNIGHLELGPIVFPGHLGGDSIAAAMNLLAGTEALILDLRGCLGGEVSMTAFVCSYLFGNEPVELSGMYQRQTDRVRQLWTYSYVPGRKFGPDKPVYVLTSARTFSGGEALSYDLQAAGRATVIGETTRGGAHPRRGFKLSPHLEATIPTGRSVHPVTGSNWEGVGVRPDVSVSAGEALSVAYRTALEHVVSTSPSRTILEEARRTLDSQS